MSVRAEGERECWFRVGFRGAWGVSYVQEVCRSRGDQQRPVCSLAHDASVMRYQRTSGCMCQSAAEAGDVDWR